MNEEFMVCGRAVVRAGLRFETVPPNVSLIPPSLRIKEREGAL